MEEELRCPDCGSFDINLGEGREAGFEMIEMKVPCLCLECGNQWNEYFELEDE